MVPQHRWTDLVRIELPPLEHRHLLLLGQLRPLHLAVRQFGLDLNLDLVTLLHLGLVFVSKVVLEAVPSSEV